MMVLETVHLHKNEKIPGSELLNVRRSSTGKTVSGDSKEKIISRYLRASIASCHDFCKYGMKETFDAKERSLLYMRVLRKSFEGQNNQHSVHTGSNNSSVAKFRMSSASKSRLSNGLNVNEQGISTKSTISQIQPKRAVLNNQINTTKSTSGVSQYVRVNRETGKLKSTLKPVSPCGSLKKSEKKLKAPLSPRSPLKGVARISARHRTLRYCSNLKSQQNLKQCASHEQDDEVEEKTLYVIKIESGNKPDKPSVEYSSSFSESLSSQGQEESNFAIDGIDDVAFSANNATENVYNRKTANKQCLGEPGKDGSNCCDDKENQSLKLRFNRGKDVDMHSDNNSPRKLGFRSGEILGQNTSLKSDARRRSSKRGSGVDGDAVGTAPGPEKVSLKHQEAEDQKESKDEGLLNNVIEKTASELIKSKKSRVKALVGAFETLISLQGKESAVSTVNSDKRKTWPSEKSCK